jgi:mannan endo-1,4-beta-mannosidase
MSPSLCGVYNDPERMDVLREMERWLGERHAVQTVFTPWRRGAIDGLFGHILPSIWDAGRVPLVTWEPYTATHATPPDIAARIAAGEFDDYLGAWASRLRDWLAGPDEQFGTADDRRLYLRPAHEMNGDWYPWSPGAGGENHTTPADYIEMWRHIHEHVERAGVTPDHLQWVWCVNHVDVGARAEECYPGDAYVDWVGVDGFNWGASRDWSAWQSPRETFSDMLDRLERLTHNPLCVPEVASSSETAAGHDPEKKAAWIREAFAYLDERVKLWCWFNEDKETDWAAFGGARGTDHGIGSGTHEGYVVYQDAMADIDGAESAEARIVSDAAFRGN